MATRGGSKLDCSICLSAFRSPKILPCFHTFCLQCLEEYVVRNGKNRKFECPLCRDSIETPAGGVKSFQSNFYILGENTSEQDIDCEVCGEGYQATHYCTVCEENFCERCTTSHMKMKVSREHTLTQLNNGNYTRKIQKKYFCPHHKGEEVKMVCKDCDTMLCVVCKLTEHENHNTSSITKEAEERQASLLEIIARANSHLNVLKSRISVINYCETDLEKELETSIALLERRVESVIAEVKKNADKIKQELLNSNTKAKDYYLEKKKLIQSKLLQDEAVISHAHNIVDSGDYSQLLDTKLVSKLQSVASTEECLIKLREHLVFKVSSFKLTADLLGRTSTIYCTHAEVKKLDELHLRWCNSTNANTLSMDAGQLFAAFTDYNKFLCHKIGTSKSNYTDVFYDSGTCPGLICVRSDVYFTSLKDKTVYILKTPDHLKTKFLTFEDYPHGIAHRTSRNSDERQELLICCLKGSKLLDMEAREGCVIAVSLRDKKQYTWRTKEMPGPACIAANTLHGTVCLGYPATHKVTLNASDGTVMSVFSGEGCYGSPENFCPVSVCFDSHFGIIIADYNNKAVIRIDELGNFCQCLVQGHTPISVLLVKNILYVGFREKNITRYQLKFNKSGIF